MSGPLRTTLAEFLGDAIVYRSLAPLDPRLPRYDELAPSVGLPPEVAPRKCQPGYARAVAGLLRAAAGRRGANGTIERVLFVGDTRENDAIAFGRICHEGGWPGIGFIGLDAPVVPASWDVVGDGARILLFASRWRLLDEVDAFCRDRGFPIDERTAAIVDIDKTAIGARGRNDGAIDRARIDAVERTLGELLGAAPPWDGCRLLYDRLNRSALHRLTADNQDVVAYLCLAIEGGLIPGGGLLGDGAADRAVDLNELLDAADRRADRLPIAALDVHRRFRGGIRRGAPPEFDAFRRNEYVSTVRRMGLLADGAPRDQWLAEGIAITGEVRNAVLRWRERGALVFGLSDKPDAGTRPTEPLAAAGYLPLHRTEAQVISGEE